MTASSTKEATIFLSIIMPLYNEEASIQAVLTQHRNMIEGISGLLKDWEIICLDDASSDRTLSILQANQPQCARLRIIRHETNQGINASYMRLHRESRGTHVYHTAGDGQWPAQNCERLLRALIREGADLAIGVRKNKERVYGRWRRLLSWGFNQIPWVLAGVKTVDANGIKLARRDFFNINVRSTSFFSEIERIIQAHQMGFKICTEEVEFLPRMGGVEKGAKFSNILVSVRDALIYSFTHLFVRFEKKDREKG